jgi:F0F1-type ATP synthase assembly protein I
LGNNPNNPDSGGSSAQKGKGANAQFALAMELPIIFVAAVVIGGGVGYFIDHWLHTKFIFTFVLGGLGFVGGLREILRRLPG